MSCAEIFSDIYARGVWGAGSGGGSQEPICWPYQRLVEHIIRERRPARVLDIGCGDGTVAAGIDWQDAQYFGVDVVAAWGDHCRPWQFDIRDALTDLLPAADLVLVKEVTQHLSNAAVQRLIDRLREYPAVLHCSAITRGSMNQAGETGQKARGIDLACAPYSLPAVDLLEWRIGEARYVAQLWEPKK